MRKAKLIVALLVILGLSLTLFYSAKWVTAQQTPKEKKEETQVSPVVPVVSPKDVGGIIFNGAVGKADPFIEPGLAAGPAQAPGMDSGTEAAQTAMRVTGIVKTNGRYYAIVVLGDKSYVLRPGDEKLGFKVSYITAKKVVFSTKEGPLVELSLVPYFKKKTGEEATLPGQKIIIPPPMEKPQEVSKPKESSVPPSTPPQEEVKGPQEKIVPAGSQEGGSK